MIFQNSMGPKIQGVTIPNGTIQGNSYPTCKSWDLKVIKGLEQTSPAKPIFFFIVEAKAC
jgi:hypothetical protein